jgi:hypothetical protein
VEGGGFEIEHKIPFEPLVRKGREENLLNLRVLSALRGEIFLFV